MFAHVNLGVSDFEQAFAFYSCVLHTLQLELKFKEDSKSWAAWQSPGQPRLLFIINKPLNGAAASAGNGQMIVNRARFLILDLFHWRVKISRRSLFE